MDQVRNFAQANRGSIVNIVYIVAAVVLVYYLVMFFFNREEKDKILLRAKTEVAVAKGNVGNLPIAESGSKGFRLKNEYTISFWIYISDYNSRGATNQPLGILSLIDESKLSAEDAQAVLFVGLHPTHPKMIIRAGGINPKASADENVIMSLSPSSTYSMNTATLNDGEASMNSLKACDVMDIDTQRWINVAISVNGRIMDVYLDGKLARSCIMDNTQSLSNSDKVQAIKLFPTTNSYNGYISGVQVSNYAVTPDVIYGRYQAGPYSSTGFLDYLVDKLGIRISYQGTGDATDTSSLAEYLGFKVF